MAKKKSVAKKPAAKKPAAKKTTAKKTTAKKTTAKKNKYEFKNTRDVNFKFIEELFKESYQDKKAKVTGVIRAKSKGKPWVDITTTASAAKTVVEMSKKEHDEVRLVLRAGDDPAYMNVPINELHVDWKYKAPRKN